MTSPATSTAGALGVRKTLILKLSSVVAGRDFADRWLRLLATDYTGAPVVIDASGTAYGSVSFATQVVRHVLVDGGADSLTVAGAPSDFASHFRRAADEADVADRLHFVDLMPDHLREIT